MRRLLRAALLICLLAATASCASYSEALVDTHTAVIRGDVDDAVMAINARMGVASVLEVPDVLEADNTLLLLERALLLQGQGRFALSARDMMAVDQRLEWLDIDKLNARDIAGYLYSEDVKNYRAPAYERLLLNTLNMINFLANYDVQGARVEARRFRIMESFYLDDAGNPLLPGLIALGNYLAGATFEASAEYDEAARFYARAWLYGIRDEDLRVRLRDLFRVSGYRGAGLESPFFVRMLEEAAQAGGMSRQAYRERHQSGDVLVIAQFGVVPYKKATRINATHALSLSSNSMDARSRNEANALIVSGALTGVNFPQLSTQGLPRRDESSARISVDGSTISLFQGMNVAASVEQAWLGIAGKLMGAALTRALTRAVIGGGSRAAGSAAMQSSDSTAAAIGVLSWLVGTGTELAMNAADTPDTRSWTTLPAQIRIGRLQLSQGLHSAQIRVGAGADKQLFPVWEDRLNLINFSKIR